jgi:hypothetical protein
VPHERKLIRDAIVTALTNATAAGTRVNKSRFAPNPQDELPAISVYWKDEATDPESRRSSPRKLKRSVNVEVVGWVVVAPGGEIDDAVDALALEIETAMDADPNFGGEAADSALVGSETGHDISGSRPMACVVLTYECTYRAALRTAAPPDKFDTLDVRVTNVGAGPIHQDNQLHDTVTNINQE